MQLRLGPRDAKELCPVQYVQFYTCTSDLDPWLQKSCVPQNEVVDACNSDWDYGYKRVVSHKVTDVCNSDWDPWLQKSCVPQNEVVDVFNSDLDPVVQKSCVLQNEVLDVCNSD